MKKKILIACEESQAICIEMRKLGLEAFSCDIQECSGGYPEWHIKGDAIQEAYSGKYDMMIAHPPCTYLSNAGARWLNENGKLNTERFKEMKKAKAFFFKLLEAPIEHIAIENPIPMKVAGLPKYNQIIQPYQFGDKAQKSTCLWLKNLPLLKPTNIVDKGEFKEWVNKKTGKKKRQALWFFEAFSKGQTAEERRKLRSKTFPGIARAIAE